MKKTILPILAIIVLVAVGYGILRIDQKLDRALEEKAEAEATALEQQERNNEFGLQTRDAIVVLDLMGTSATSPFTFASSTETTYWNTDTSNYPHEYGATPTAAFLINGAEAVTFEGVFQPKIAASKMDLYIFGSNDTGCNNSSSTLNLSKWYPMPVVPTTTAYVAGTMTLGAHATTSVLAIDASSTNEQPFSLALPKEYLNFNCLMVEAGNSSTTDASTLWLEVSIVR